MVNGHCLCLTHLSQWQFLQVVQKLYLYSEQILTFGKLLRPICIENILPASSFCCCQVFMFVSLLQNNLSPVRACKYEADSREMKRTRDASENESRETIVNKVLMDINTSCADFCAHIHSTVCQFLEARDISCSNQPKVVKRSRDLSDGDVALPYGTLSKKMHPDNMKKVRVNNSVAALSYVCLFYQELLLRITVVALTNLFKWPNKTYACVTDRSCNAADLLHQMTNMPVLVIGLYSPLYKPFFFLLGTQQDSTDLLAVLILLIWGTHRPTSVFEYYRQAIPL